MFKESGNSFHMLERAINIELLGVTYLGTYLGTVPNNARIAYVRSQHFLSMFLRETT